MKRFSREYVIYLGFGVLFKTDLAYYGISLCDAIAI